MTLKNSIENVKKRIDLLDKELDEVNYFKSEIIQDRIENVYKALMFLKPSDNIYSSDMKVKYKGKEYKVLAIDFEGVCIRKGEPSVIINDNDGCIKLSECEIIYPQSDEKVLCSCCNTPIINIQKYHIFENKILCCNCFDKV
jgi:hypothetical protein